MNCPVCGSEIDAGVKYCPVCGTDVEGAQARTQQMPPVYAAPTQQMPVQQPAVQYAAPAPEVEQAVPQPQGTAVPMTPSMPPQVAGRSLDTSKMGGSPKWPIVVICVLLVIIAVILLFLFRPWDQSSMPTGQNNGTTGTAGTSIQTVVGQNGQSGQQGQQGQVSEPPADGAAAQADADAQVYQSLTGYYDQLAGFDGQISTEAGTFNNEYLNADQGVRSSYASQASALLDSINANLAGVQALAVSQTSPYYDTWTTIVTLYECLSNRARVIAEAWNVSAGAADPAAQTVQDQIGAILGADNVNGVNRYKTQYNELYPNARPQQL